MTDNPIYYNKKRPYVVVSHWHNPSNNYPIFNDSRCEYFSSLQEAEEKVDVYIQNGISTSLGIKVMTGYSILNIKKVA
tara:strand:+ start:471 stop:704 length:234 start_codon:yes stop_codon:yes gene_type:complete